jgi:hypothetical protein
MIIGPMVLLLLVVVISLIGWQVIWYWIGRIIVKKGFRSYMYKYKIGDRVIVMMDSISGWNTGLKELRRGIIEVCNLNINNMPFYKIGFVDKPYDYTYKMEDDIEFELSYNRNKRLEEIGII